MASVQLDAVAVDEIPGGGAVALVGPPTDLLWIVRADARADQIAAEMSKIGGRICARYEVDEERLQERLRARRPA